MKSVSSVPSRASSVTITAANAATTTITNNNCPILLSFTSHGSIELGYSGTISPKHTIDICPQTIPEPINVQGSELLFSLYSAPLATLWRRCFGNNYNHNHNNNNNNNNNNIHCQNRRSVVILHEQGLYLNRYWKLAICRILSNVLLVKAQITFCSTLHMVPLAITMPPVGSTTISQQYERNQSVVVTLTVYLSVSEVQCMVHAGGYPLDYTYQSCPYTFQQQQQHNEVVEDWNSNEKGIHDGTIVRNLQINLLQQPHFFIRAICQCLEQCPMTIRKSAVHNILIAGIVMVPDFGRHLTRILYNSLMNHHTTTAIDSSTIIPHSQPPMLHSSIPDNVPSNMDSVKDDSKTEQIILWTENAIPWKQLQPLAPFIALIDVTNVAPMTLAWLGASLWSWHQFETTSEGIDRQQQIWTDLEDEVNL